MELAQNGQEKINIVPFCSTLFQYIMIINMGFITKYICTVFLIFFLCLQMAAQEIIYTPPLQIPLLLSANFCELRANHFHSGVDFKTQQRIGLPVYSIADGHVYRIVVSPSGYGRALYIEHPNGESSLYGHLDRFNDEIESYVKSEQYRRQSFAVDLAPEAGKLKVEQGGLIAYSGNTGGSLGPHLHFEIRDSQTQDALNPLAYGFDIADNTPPRIYVLMVYPLSDNSHVNFSENAKKYILTSNGNSYRISPDQPIPVFEKIGFAIQANDFYDLSHNICGIYSAKLFVDDREIFSYVFDRMAFDETRFMNSHIDYHESVSARNMMHRLFRLPGNKLQIYQNEVNRGIVEVKDGEIRDIRIEVDDMSGNKVVLTFQLKGSFREIQHSTPDFTRFFTYDEDHFLQTPWIEFYAPEGAFYDDFYFKYDVSQPTPDLFSKVHHLHSETVPIHRGIKLRILSENIPDSLASKSFIGKISNSGRKSYAGGKKIGDWFETEIRSFGNYAVMVDTIPPRIVPLSIQNNALIDKNKIRFTISDNITGIKKYEGFIDDTWVLFEFDAKNNLLFHIFDDEIIEMNKIHTFKLNVTDNMNNTSVYETTFFR